jgi:hypothetical protein
LPGQTLRLAVSTTAPRYDVVIFRVSGRAPVESPFERVTVIKHQPGRLQSGPIVDPVTRMTSARWTFTTKLTIPTTWASGIYLARLQSSEQVQSYVPFVIRSPSATRFLVVSSALNWQAYNTWGGSSLYVTHVGEPLPGVTRALAVSFDRPYAYDGGAGQLFFLELPMVAWLERQGLDVSYTTDYDLSVNPDAQPLPKVVIFNGHDEYWGVQLRQWLDPHVLTTGDMSLGVFAADTGYWPVSLSAAGPDGPRIVTCFKNGPVPASLSGSSSPSPGAATPTPEPDATALTPGGGGEEKGGQDIASFPPSGPYVGHYQVQSLLGVGYQAITSAMGQMSLARPFPEPSLLEGTGLGPGALLGYFAGGEVDGVYQDPSEWGPLGGAYDHVIAGSYGIPSRHGVPSMSEAVIRSLPNGARVFASGTFYWGWALDPTWAGQNRVQPGLGRLTLNILRFLAGS